MTGSPALGCGPAFVTWSANTLYLVKADGGFSGTSLVKGTELERTTIEALVDTTSSLVAKRTILDVQTGEGAFAVVYQQAAQVAPLDSDAGVDARGVAEHESPPSYRKAAGWSLRCSKTSRACPNAAGAKLTAVWPSVDARGLEVLRVCGNGAFEWRYARDQVLGGARAVLAQSPGSFAAAQRSGVLSLGAGPRSVVGLTAAEPIQTVFEASGHTLFTGESSYSSPSRLGLETSFSTRAQGNLIRAWVPFGRMTTVLRNGVVLDRDADGGLIFLAGTPEGTPPVSDAALVPPALLAVTAGDSLWTITLDPMMPSLLQVRARPVPGFPITSLALRPHRSQGAFEGYLISASRLFSVDAPSLNRVNLSEVALEQDDPVQVWFDGPPGASRGRLLLRSGALRSLPGLLVLAPGVGSDEAIEARSVCSSTVQLTSTGLFQLDSPDGGTGVWRRVDALGSDAGLSFSSGAWCRWTVARSSRFRGEPPGASPRSVADHICPDPLRAVEPTNAVGKRHLLRRGVPDGSVWGPPMDSKRTVAPALAGVVLLLVCATGCDKTTRVMEVTYCRMDVDCPTGYLCESFECVPKNAKTCENVNDGTPILQPTPHTVDFGMTTSNAAQTKTVTLSNIGNCTLTLFEANLAKPDGGIGCEFCRLKLPKEIFPRPQRRALHRLGAR